ncbi:MAG: hypothetical protein JRI59_07310 [Deltaproteobacteria bacterium]|nr:hypothetical protein [Deltaproteobacteria bacterium]
MKKAMIMTIFVFLLGIIVLTILSEKYSWNMKWWQEFFIYGVWFIVSIIISIKIFCKYDKSELIKSLAIKRVKESPILKDFATDLIREINKMSDNQLMGLPEASIVAICETYYKLKSQGMSDEDTFKIIEDHRAILSGSGELPSPLTLNSYIKYRISHELNWSLSQGSISFYARASFSDEFVDKAIKEASRFFSK